VIMAGFSIITARAIPLPMDNVDTDQIFPARFFSKKRGEGMYGTYFLHDLRFDELGRPQPGVPFDDPRYSGARILVAAANYGYGSARPGAIHSHLDYGLQVVVAESFGPAFASVAYKSGLLTIALEKDSLQRLRDSIVAGPGKPLTVDVAAQRISGPDGARYPFEIEHFMKRMIIEGRSEIEITCLLADRINAFEQRHRESLPWLHPRAPDREPSDANQG